MGNPYSDKVEAEVLEPIVLNPNTVNEYDDAALLQKDEIATGDNIIFDDKIIEKVRGTNKYNTDTASNPVYGLHRAYPAGTGGTKKLLRLSNAKLQSDAPAYSGTALLSSLASIKTPFIDIKGKAYGVNSTDGIIRYDPVKDQAVKTAIIGPYLRKKIAFFESDETWTDAGGSDGSASTDTDHYRIDEFSGKSTTSLKITTTGTRIGNATISLDLSAFSNTKTSGDDDLIVFYAMPSSYVNLSYVTITFNANDTSNYFQLKLYKADFEPYNYEWNKFEIKKSSFIRTGSPDWSTVTKITIQVTATASETVYFDYIYLKSATIKGVEMRRQIANCDSADGFSGTKISIDNQVYYGYSTTKNSSILFAATTNETLTAASSTITQVDLSTWPNGGTSTTADEIVFFFYCDDVSKLAAANTLILRLGETDAIYWEYTFTDHADLGITNKSDQWVEIRIAKSAFSDTGGITLWSAIDYCAIVIDFETTGTNAYIDDIHMEPYRNIQSIADFESDETWTVTGKGGQESNTQMLGELKEGSKALLLYGGSINSFEESSALIDWTLGVKSFATFDGTVVSSTDDFISFSMYHQARSMVEYVEIWFDGLSLATFANAFKYRIDQSMLAEGNLTGKIYEIKKSSFEQIGSPDWSTIGACKIVAKTKGNNNANSPLAGGGVLFDNLVLKRKKGNTGRYYYKYAFITKDVSSPCSEISEAVDVRGSFVLLSNIATSADTRVTARKVYRLGGTYPNTWMLVATIENNTDTTWVDELDDNDLIYTLGDEVPSGNIENVPCLNLSYDPTSNRALYWGDPTYKNRLYISHEGFYHVVDETGYRELQDDLMYAQPWHGQIILVFKHTKKKIIGDPFTGDIVDLPVTTGSASYYGVKKVSQTLLACCAWDNVYLFDGYKDIPIGDKVKNWFKDMEDYIQYMVIGYHMDNIYISCRDTSSSTYNDNVLRYHIPTKSWSVLPDWNVNIWSNWDKQDDKNEFYYGDSVTNNAIQIEYTSGGSPVYQFTASAISSTVKSGWFNDPNQEIAIHMIEFKAKGTASSTLIFKGYKDYSATHSCSGTVTFPSTVAWRTYRLGPKNIHNIMRGDALRIEFTHSSDSAYFKMKDISVHIEKLPKRITLNEVTVS